MDSALRDKSWISARVRRLHTPSMRPCTRLKNLDLLKKPAAASPCSPCTASLVFSSQILESFASFYILALILESTFLHFWHFP
ncbi:hypothetical protein [Helicobacter canis]|uniref:hypothetical protein n=1 Tax=Helicobacter canis TaxID=29419 RepID=UPI0011C059ED|nr:hypothetical protein [Helicobacter canis]